MNDPKPLFTLTEDHLETGLRGVPVGYCTTSKVDPKKGLHYVGRPIAELADADPEDVIHLLLHKHLPSEEESRALRADLLERREKVDPRVVETMKALPREGHPMKWFLHAINALGMTEASGDYCEDCRNLIAQIPVVTAALFRLREGWGEPIAPTLDGYMESFVEMLGVPGLDDDGTARLTRLMRVFDVLHFDHGGGNLSAFTGKAVASGLADMFESITAAMCGLAGPRHGKANAECLDFVRHCVEQVGGDLDRDKVAQVIEDRLANKQLIFGFGHAVLRVEDPRATAFIGLGDELCPDDANFRMVKLLREVVPEILKKNPRISNPYPNVDLGSGSLLNACGLDDSSYYTVLFGLSRVVGIAIQIVYERSEARGGRGTPIVRPKFIYDEQGSA